MLLGVGGELGGVTYTREAGLGFAAEEEFASARGFGGSRAWERSKVPAVFCWVAWEGGKRGGY